MAVHRIIFRFDYPTSFDYFDGQGAALSLLESKSPENFWTEFRDKKSGREIVSAFKDPKCSRVITVAPQSINGAIESLEGWNLDSLNSIDELQHIWEVISALRDRFSLYPLHRAGVRCMYLGSPFSNLDQIRAAFRKSLDFDELFSDLEQTLGPANDYVWAIDGAHEDGLSYHFKAGPYKSSEAHNYFNDFTPEIQQRTDYVSIVDLDIFESEPDIPVHRTAKWMTVALQRVCAAIQVAEQTMTASL